MLQAMHTRNSLAVIVNELSDDLLATISRDDALTLFEGLLDHAGQPEVDAALDRLGEYLWGDVSLHRAGTARRVLH
jgi:hypothetical protein